MTFDDLITIVAQTLDPGCPANDAGFRKIHRVTLCDILRIAFDAGVEFERRRAEEVGEQYD